MITATHGENGGEGDDSMRQQQNSSLTQLSSNRNLR